MQRVLCIAPLVILATVVGSARAEPKGALSKVIDLLQDLEAKIKTDSEVAQKQFQEYANWCRMSAQELKVEVKVGNSETDNFEANIQKASADLSSSSTKIEELAAAISEDEAELKQAEAIRAKENKEFSSTEKELLDTVDTLERASNVLQRKLRGSSLLETKVDRNDVKNLINTLNEVVNAASLSLHDQKTLISLAQSGEDDDYDLMGAPAATAYKGHGSSVVDLIEDLKQKAERQLADLRKQETNSRFNFESMKVSLQDQTVIGNKELAEAKGTKARASEAKATNEGDLSTSAKDLATAKGRLVTLMRECVSAAQERDAEIQERASEIQTIREASKILQAHTTSEAASFLLQQTKDNDGFKVVNFLRDLAQKQQNAAFAQLAGRISTVVTRATSGHVASADVFKVVKEMIEKMIARLETEAKSESSHKAYCDKEIKEAATKKDDTSFDVEKLSAQIDKAKSKSVSLKDQIQSLQVGLAELVKSAAEADHMRAEASGVYNTKEKALRNEMTAVRGALKLLKDHFGKPSRGAAAALIQERTESYRRATTKIITLLEVIEEDFSKSLATAEAEEKLAQSAYEKFKRESDIAKAQKEQALKLKTKDSSSLDRLLTEHASDLESVQSELASILDYKKNIDVMCKSGPETYDSRKARRDSELDGLQEALRVLSGQAVLLQRAPIRLRSGTSLLHRSSK